ncbi:MAG TPA: hypothetical protein VKU82_08345 [Planctomycetaceae bacterium]|nr:hypothetical protein [Planctomycetaceae bacterium]
MKAAKRHQIPSKSGRAGSRRRGAATLDYVLVMGAVLPMAALAYYYSTRILRAVYEMTCALVCWPFM